MAARFYNRGIEALLSDRPWTSHAMQVLLVYNTYTFDADHDTVADVVAGEASGTGYARLVVANKTVIIDDVNDRTAIDADDFSWSSINTGGTPIAGYIIAANTGTDAVDELICYNDSGGFPFTLGGSDFQVVHNTAGIGYIST